MDLEGLWLITFGTRLEVVAATSEDGARHLWRDMRFPERHHGRYAPPLLEEIGCRALEHDDLERLEEWERGFTAKILRLRK